MSVLCLCSSPDITSLRFRVPGELIGERQDTSTESPIRLHSVEGGNVQFPKVESKYRNLGWRLDLLVQPNVILNPDPLTQCIKSPSLSRGFSKLGRLLSVFKNIFDYNVVKMSLQRLQVG